MTIKRVLFACLAIALATAVIKAAPLAVVFTGGLRTQARVPAPATWPAADWPASTPEEQGLDSALIAGGIRSMLAGQAQVDSLLIIRNGRMVLDAHFAPYDGSFPHDLASVTKSFITTLIGIAADQGILDLDQTMVSFFPQRTIANLDERKMRITIRDLVSMRNGMESGCYEADEPTLDAMRSQADWVQAALDRPMVGEPGREFCYDSPGMHILSAILQEASGMTALEFARRNLFEPLGIHEMIWETDPQGITRGWGDLHLLPEDLARMGLLWLQRGQWDGRQIVSEKWVLDSVKLHSSFIEPDFGYGYGWWITPGDYQASGRGGQRMRVIASRNVIIVVTAAESDYSEIEDWLNPILLQAKDTLPANPAGEADLASALAEAAREDPAWQAGYTPATAARISGHTYLCEDNLAGLGSVRIDFDQPGQAALQAVLDGAAEEWAVGLQGRYLVTPRGSGFRGYWMDAQTFHIEVFNIGVDEQTVVFDGGNLQFSLPGAGLTVTCQGQGL